MKDYDFGDRGISFTSPTMNIYILYDSIRMVVLDGGILHIYTKDKKIRIQIFDNENIFAHLKHILDVR